MAKSFPFPCPCHSGCWCMSSVNPAKLGIFLQNQRRSLLGQGFPVSSSFLLPVLVPSCFESLLQLQPGKRLTLQHGLTVSTGTIICGWNQVIGKYNYTSPCKCWGQVTQSPRRSRCSHFSCSLSSFGLCKSVFRLLHSFPTFFRLTPGKTFHFLTDSLTLLFLTQIPLQDLAEMTFL